MSTQSSFFSIRKESCPPTDRPQQQYMKKKSRYTINCPLVQILCTSYEGLTAKSVKSLQNVSTLEEGEKWSSCSACDAP